MGKKNIPIYSWRRINQNVSPGGKVSGGKSTHIYPNTINVLLDV
jgi:hypothetical protein